MTDVIQSLKVGRSSAVLTFSEPIWVGTPGGLALPTDPNPNTTAPATGRICRCATRYGQLACSVFGTFIAAAIPIAGGSITIQPWYFDATQGAWIQWGAPQAITATGGASSNIFFSGNFALWGAPLFAQITANANVQAMSYGFY